jgi:hypothetical protein
MRTVCTALTLAFALLIAAPSLAAAKKKEGGNGVPYFQAVDRYLRPVTLTDDQKAKISDLKKEYEPKLKELYSKQDVRTPDQKKAGQDAAKAARAAGKKGQDVRTAVADAEKKTDDQKNQEQAIRKELRSLQNELHKRVVELLTQEQKDQVAAARKGGKSTTLTKPDEATKPADAKKPADAAKPDSAAKVAEPTPTK